MSNDDYKKEIVNYLDVDEIQHAHSAMHQWLVELGFIDPIVNITTPLSITISKKKFKRWQFDDEDSHEMFVDVFYESGWFGLEVECKTLYDLNKLVNFVDDSVIKEGFEEAHKVSPHGSGMTRCLKTKTMNARLVEINWVE
jgi:hypothetical protein